MSVKTKFGSAYIDTQGYLRISSMKEGNHNKLVHRLVFEDFYQTNIPDDWVIHHEDGDKLNNEIWNLVPMTNVEHSVMHHTGVKFTKERCKNISEAKKGFKFSEESKQKMREAKLGKKQSLNSIIARTKTMNTTGIFRVFKAQNKSCKQGWDYCYNYTENGKRKEMHSVNILKLQQKVLDKGLDWIILDKEKLIKTVGPKLADRIINTIQDDTYKE